MLRTLLLSAAVGVLSLNAYAADDTPKPEVKPNAKDVKPEVKPDAKDVKPEVKAEEKAIVEVYRLKIVEPNDALQALHALVGTGPAVRRPRTTIEDPTGGGGGRVGRGGTATRPGGGVASDFSGSSSGSVMETRSTAALVCRGVADLRTRSLVVRGTAKDQQIAADLVAVLDTTEGKALPGTKVVKAFRLENLDANDLVVILQQLDPYMTYRLAPVPRMKLLLATGSDEQMKELANTVKKLDIPADGK